MPFLRSGNRWSLELRKNLLPLLLGFLATSFQVLILREFEVRFFGNELVYGLVLAFWLLGGGAGSLLAEKKFLKGLTPSRFYLATGTMACGLLILLRFSRFIFGVLPTEMTGAGPIVIASLLIAFSVSLPLGALFVYNVFWYQGNLAIVYQLEALGAALGGLGVYLVLVPHFSNWQAAALIILVTGLIMVWITEGKKFFLILFTAITVLGLWLFDFQAERIYWKPFQLLAVQDSPYARLQAIKTEEQVSFYTNSFLAFNFPDPASAEESIHFAFLQRPDARKALLIGGGLNGALGQALQYPEVKIDYVELDPGLVKLAVKVLGEKALRLDDPRLNLYLRDGRKFIKQTQEKYDLILSNLPEPATAQVNRFFTVEFFSELKKKLRPEGVFSFSLPSSENYLSEERAQLLASVYKSLLYVFKQVRIIPGDNNIFLASDGELDDSLATLVTRLELTKIRTSYFRPELLSNRLQPLKKDYLFSRIHSVPNPRLNSDWAPISYFYQTLLWSQHFRGSGNRILYYLFSHLNRFWLFNLPLAIFLILILGLAFTKKQTSTSYLLPLMVMGFTTIIAEIGFILAFQSSFGLVYSKISLLFTLFMFGLFSGSWLSRTKFSNLNLKHLMAVQAGFVIFLLLTQLIWKTKSELIFYSLLFIMGLLSGILFIVSNSLYLRYKSHYGLGYALDLFGSFLGALLATTFFVPLLGLELLFTFLLLINSLGLSFLLFRNISLK